MSSHRTGQRSRRVAAPPAATRDRLERAPAGLPPATATARERSSLALPMVLLAAVAIAALGYLTIVKLTNSTAVCFVVQGCDQVQASRYSTFLGIPVAVYGLVVAVVILGAAIGWWRTGQRRLLYVPYGLGLVSVFVIAGLVYLELFVIRAICIWCTLAGASLVLGWFASVVAVWRSGEAS